MLGIDPWTIDHEIKTYPNAKPIQYKIREVIPKKNTHVERCDLENAQSKFHMPCTLDQMDIQLCYSKEKVEKHSSVY